MLMASRWRVLWVNVLSTAALLLAIEYGSRLVMRVDFPDPLVTDQRSDWKLTREYDPLLFWRMRARIERNGETLTNSLGLRGPEVEPRAHGEFRILSLGESTTFGIRLRYEHTYSARLEEELKQISDRPVRVVNAGVPGYSLFQGVTYLKYRGLSLEPDVVLVYFGYNDFLPVSFRVERDAAADPTAAGVTDRELFELRQRASYRFTYALAERSNLVRYLLFGRQHDLAIATDSTRPRVPEADRRRLLDELAELAAKHQFLLVIIVPWYRSFNEHAPLLRDFCSAAGVPIVDLPEILGELPRPQTDYFVDSIHPNSEGHDLIAKALAREPSLIRHLKEAALRHE